MVSGIPWGVLECVPPDKGDFRRSQNLRPLKDKKGVSLGFAIRIQRKKFPLVELVREDLINQQVSEEIIMLHRPPQIVFN